VLTGDKDTDRTQKLDIVKPLEREYLVLDCGAGPVQCLVDSGCDISVFKYSMIKQDLNLGTPIHLQAAFGKKITAFQLHVDSSEHTIAGCLSQFDDQNNLRPIAFMSKKLDQVQCRWDIVSKESYSIVHSIKNV